MVTLVRRRKVPLRRKKYSVQKHIGIGPIKQLRSIAKYVWIFSIVIIFILVTRTVLQRTIFAPVYTIREVKYDSGTVAIYDDPYLYKTVSDYLIGRNINLVKLRGKRELLSHIRVVFPLVDRVELFYLYDHTAAIRLEFVEPDMLLRIGDTKFVVYQSSTFRLYPTNTLGRTLQSIELPSYLSDLDDLDGIFYITHPEHLQSFVEGIHNSFSQSPRRLVFLPGAERIMVVAADGKHIYFNLLQDFDDQIRKLNRLKSYYAEFAVLQEIDLGSLDMYKVIVKK